MTVRREACPLPLRREAYAPGGGGRPVSGFRAWWLGQAGFLFEGGGLRILVDPYLSDSLALKYRGTRFPHTRMSPPPVSPASLRDIDFVLVSHGHSDHLDPGTLPLVAAENPACRFVLPKACLATAVERGVGERVILAVDSGDRLDLGMDPLTGTENRLAAVPAAHEELVHDGNGHYLHLGYVLSLGGLSLYHSGDCVPYPGLAKSLSGVDVAFLPVNGRDAERTAAGIIGNFTLAEALDLVLSVPLGFGVGHHFGLFGFNTIDPAEGRRYLEGRPESAGRFALAEEGTMFEFSGRLAP